MKKEAKLLLNKAINSLILSIEHFNRPWNPGRSEAVLILLDHAFEMFLKSAIIRHAGSIREKGAEHTIGFSACVRKGLTDGKIKFLTEEQALTLQAINSLRDAAQHYLLDISEQHLYMQAQAGLTLFKDLYLSVFKQDLLKVLPERVLPVSTLPPSDLSILFDHEVSAIKTLLAAGNRRKIEAKSKLQAIAILDQAMTGKTVQPSEAALNSLANKIAKLKDAHDWPSLFPGVAGINFVTNGTGLNLCLRITKKEGTAIQIVKEDFEDSPVVAVRRVNELDFYNLSPSDLASKLQITAPKLLALVNHLELQKSPDNYKKIKVGKTEYQRYSQHALRKLKEAVPNTDMEQIWKDYQLKKRNSVPTQLNKSENLSLNANALS